MISFLKKATILVSFSLLFLPSVLAAPSDTNTPASNSSPVSATADTNSDSSTADEATAAHPKPTFEQKDIVYEFGTVLRVTEKEEAMSEEDPSYNPKLPKDQKRIIQQIELRINSGTLRDKVFTVENRVENLPKNIRVQKGDHVQISIATVEGKSEPLISVIQYERGTSGWIMIIAFMVALIAFGGRKGIGSVIGLVSTFLMIFFVFIPTILKGGNPLPLAIGTSIIVTFLVHVFVAGFSPKSLSSTIGTAGGAIIAGVFAWGSMQFAHIVGLSSEEAVYLFTDFNPNLDFRGIFLASVVLGSLGAVMDVGISISSAVSEVKEHMHSPSFEKLFKAGMNVGKDILGTMSNTLILAYVGSALPLILLLVSYDNLSMALNYDFISDEVIRSVAGSFGLLATIPIVAFFSAKLEMRGVKEKIVTT